MPVPECLSHCNAQDSRIVLVLREAGVTDGLDRGRTILDHARRPYSVKVNICRTDDFSEFLIVGLQTRKDILTIIPLLLNTTNEKSNMTLRLLSLKQNNKKKTTM